jgi:hypothetical protein
MFFSYADGRDELKFNHIVEARRGGYFYVYFVEYAWEDSSLSLGINLSRTKSLRLGDL